MTDIEKPIQKEESDLYQRSIKSGYWVFALRFATQGLGFVKAIIIANCLLLENLGLISIAIILMEILNTFSESGMNAALVQQKKDISDYLDTAWVISIVRGILLFVVLFFAAPLFASVKVSDENISLAINVMRVMGICLLVEGFRNIGIVYFQKNMEFHKTFWMQITGTLTDIVLSTILVLLYRSIWGYVVGRLISACVGCTLSYLLCSYRPKFHFDSYKAKELWKYGKWILGNKILGFALERGDDIFVWFYLNPAQLALYERSFRFSNMPATHISQTISQVSFPAYSKIQDDLPRLREAYLKVLKITAMLSFPAAFFIFILGPDFVKLFLKPYLHPMIPALQILAFKGLFRSMGSTRGPLFQALGKPQINMHFQWFRLIILAIAIYPLTRIYSIAGTAFATLLVALCINPMGFLLACRLLKCSVRKMLAASFIPLISSLIMILVTIALKIFVFSEPSFTVFFGLAALGITLYLIILWTLDGIFNLGYRQLLLDHFVPLNNKLKTKWM